MTRDLLRVEHLRVEFPSPHGPLAAVRDVGLSLAGGEAVGVVGESGCGKSVTALSLLGLVPPPGRVVVRFTDGGTGGVANIHQIHWHAERPWASGGTLQVVDRDPETHSFEFRAPQGRILISAGHG